MGYKTILVHVDTGKHCMQRIESAIELAKRFDAGLVGLHVFSPYAPPGYIMAHMGQEIMEAQEKAAVELMARTKETFHKQVSSAGLEDVEWHTAYDDLVYETALLARYTDIIVISQSDSSGASATAVDFPERLVLTAGRPVLILPYAGAFNAIGTRIIIAWNASREATRAVTNAIPFLKLAESVFVLAVNPKGSDPGNIQSEGIVRYLARHGVRVEVNDAHGSEIDVGNELLSRAADLSADLIVMGGYGHSRFKEWVLGGATRTILESMTIPVLMSH